MQKIIKFIKKIFLVFLVLVLSVLLVSTKPAPIIQWKPTMLAVKLLTVKNIFKKYGRELKQISTLTGVPLTRLVGFTAKESLGNKNICSKAKACGLMQTRLIADQATGIAGTECNDKKAICQILKGAAYLVHLTKVENIEGSAHSAFAYLYGPSAMRQVDEEKIFTEQYVIDVHEYAWIAERVVNKKL